MDDSKIIDLYWQRSDKAISETEKKYGNYCRAIANNFVSNNEDAEECVNDTWFSAWNQMPDKRPSILSAFLGKITRNIAISVYRKRTSKKHGRGETALALEELADCVPSGIDLESDFENAELEELIRNFALSLNDTEQKVFVSRYWYLASIKEISKCLNCSESKTKSILFRVRKKLRARLEEEYI